MCERVAEKVFALQQACERHNHIVELPLTHTPLPGGLLGLSQERDSPRIDDAQLSAASLLPDAVQ